MRRLAISIYDDERQDIVLASGSADVPEGKEWRHALGEALGRFLRQDFAQVEYRTNVIDLEAEREKRRVACACGRLHPRPGA